MPQRIQRQRTRGWRMPENAVYVGRPTKWGNPYWDVRRYGINLCLQAFRNTVEGYWTPFIVPEGTPNRDIWLDDIYKSHHAWLTRLGHRPYERIHELRGKDLVCWCPLNQPCHADVLLEIANS